MSTWSAADSCAPNTANATISSASGGSGHVERRIRTAPALHPDRPGALRDKPIRAPHERQQDDGEDERVAVADQRVREQLLEDDGDDAEAETGDHRPGERAEASEDRRDESDQYGLDAEEWRHAAR